MAKTSNKNLSDAKKINRIGLRSSAQPASENACCAGGVPLELCCSVQLNFAERLMCLSRKLCTLQLSKRLRLLQNLCKFPKMNQPSLDSALWSEMNLLKCVSWKSQRLRRGAAILYKKGHSEWPQWEFGEWNGVYSDRGSKKRVSHGALSGSTT